MPNIVIAGGGFAGVWAAASAVRLLRDHGATATMSSAAALESHLLRLPQRQPAAGRFAAVVVGAGSPASKSRPNSSTGCAVSPAIRAK